MRVAPALPWIGFAFVAITCAAPAPLTTTPHRPAPGSVDPDVPQGRVPRVWVRLDGPERSGTAHVRVRGNWVLRGANGGTLASGSGLDSRIALREWGALVLDGRSHRDPPFTLVPSAPGDLSVGERRYRGTLRFEPGSDGRMHLDVVTDLETYLEGVVHGEIPALFPPEAQRAQAIVARTYALATLRDRSGDRIRVSDSGSKDQEFHGVPATESAARIVREAVETTRGEVAIDGRRPVSAWYHSTCGDHTAPAESVFPVAPTPPLSGVVCGHCSASKYYRWTARIDGAQVAAAAGLPAPLQDFRVLNTTSGGRAVSFVVRAGGQSRTVQANSLRLRIGAGLLRSTFVDAARVSGGALSVSGRGWGHGVGLCQMGAKSRAEEGETAEEIVAAYYPGSRLVRLW